MTTNHTPGPWQAVQMYSDAMTVLDPKGFEIVEATRTAILPDYEERLGVGHWALSEQAHRYLSDEEQAANARLIAAAPELLEALEEAVDLAWIEDSHQVEFDLTVRFSEFYDFSRLDGTSRIEFYGQHSCIVWPGAKWSAYCTYDGSLWFEKFDTAQEAKEACMRLLDQVLPDHPAMRARAVMRKARGEQ